MAVSVAQLTKKQELHIFITDCEELYAEIQAQETRN